MKNNFAELYDKLYREHEKVLRLEAERNQLVEYIEKQLRANWIEAREEAQDVRERWIPLYDQMEAERDRLKSELEWQAALTKSFMERGDRLRAALEQIANAPLIQGQQIHLREVAREALAGSKE